MKIHLSQNSANELSRAKTRQFSTFYVDGRYYGIDVMKVQEVTKTMPITPIRCAPKYVIGLINLRGQIATALGLSELFQLPERTERDRMTVVCRLNENLVSLLVDEIGDVIEVVESAFEPTPATVHPAVKEFLEGVYKTPKAILSVVSIEKVIQQLDKRSAA